MASVSAEIARQARDEHRAQQKYTELELLLDLVRSRDVHHVVEIGGMYGGTLWALRQVATGKCICVDWFQSGGPGSLYLHRHRSEGLLEYASDYVLVNADSTLESTRDTVLEHLDGEPLDFLFIDGDHSLPGVTRDFELYSPLVKKGGLIALHDTAKPQPQVAGHDVIPLWLELKERYPYVEIFDSAFEGTWGGIGVVLV